MIQTATTKGQQQEGITKAVTEGTMIYRYPVQKVLDNTIYEQDLG